MLSFLFISILLMFLCTTFMQWLWRPEDGIKSPETRVTDSCEPPYGCWELNLEPLKNSQRSQPLSYLSSLCQCCF